MSQYLGLASDDAEATHSVRGAQTQPSPEPKPVRPSVQKPLPKEIGGGNRPEPTRYGDWEHKGAEGRSVRAVDSMQRFDSGMYMTFVFGL